MKARTRTPHTTSTATSSTAANPLRYQPTCVESTHKPCQASCGVIEGKGAVDYVVREATQE